jgi:hypothetical protein
MIERLAKPLRVLKGWGGDSCSGQNGVLDMLTREATYWEDNDNVLLAFYDDGKVETHLESFESFVDEDVLDGCGWNEARGCS